MRLECAYFLGQTSYQWPSNNLHLYSEQKLPFRVYNFAKSLHVIYFMSNVTTHNSGVDQDA